MKPVLNIAIFIIDDSQDMVDAIGRILEQNGFTDYHLFTDPQELLAALHDNVHVCIVDYKLTPGMNGLQVIEKVVQKNPHCYFIMLSGQDDPNVVIRYMNMVYGGRYVEKAKEDTFENIIKYLKEIISHINSVSELYNTLSQVKKEVKNLKKIITHEPSDHHN